MKNRKKLFIWLPIFLVLVGLAFGIVFLVSRFQAAKIPPNKQHESYKLLQENSEIPINLYFENGFPRFVHGRVMAKGENTVERAWNFLQNYQDLYLQASPDLKLSVRRVNEAMGLENVTFYQTYKGVQVYGGEIVVNLDDEWIYGTVGGILTLKVDLDVTPAISDRDAEAISLVDVGMPDAPVIGNTSLVVFDFSLIEDATPDPRLAWHVNLGGSNPWETIVDAHSGEVLSSVSTIFDAYGLMLTDQNGAMTADCFNDTDIDLWIGTEEVLMSGYQSDPDAVAAWNFSKDVYDFYAAFGLDSYDNNGAEAKVQVHASVPNAVWIPGCSLIRFNDGWLSWDVMVHEYGHAVISYSSKLGFSGQPRSLNESFADGMAVMADPDEWFLADTTTGNVGVVRDLSNMDVKHMDAYNAGASAYDNLGIPDTAIYLISDGGTFGDLQITGIGRIKMAWLYFATLRSVGSGAKFIDARNQMVATAEDWAQDGYGGFTENDLCQVRNAYYAVGLGDPDLDCDGKEDAIDPDTDGDTISNPVDNCPEKWNPGQEDLDLDGIGDICDPDLDGDGINQVNKWNWQLDNCPRVPNPEQIDSDMDGIGRVCDEDEDSDMDNDGIHNLNDNCPQTPNPKVETSNGSGIFAQPDMDNDGEGDACDPDDDGDKFSNDNDNCPFTSNPDQADTDKDGIGDECDKCPTIEDTNIAWSTGNPDLEIDPYPIQPDGDKDGIPDTCDTGAWLVGAPWSIDNIFPDGLEQEGGVIGDPLTNVLLPIPNCPPNMSGGFSPNLRQLLLVHGLDSSISARVIDSDGSNVGNPQINGSHYMSFVPRGGETYFLRLGFGPNYPANLATSFKIAQFCEPKNLLPDISIRKSFQNEEPTPTTTPTPTFTPTLTVTPTPEVVACTWTAAINIFVSKGPSSSKYETVWSYTPGNGAPIVGQSIDLYWWALFTPAGVGYVPQEARFGETSGDCETMPMLTSIPISIPTNTPTPIITQCNDGIDNDRDGKIDYDDSGGMVYLGDVQCTSFDDNDESN